MLKEFRGHQSYINSIILNDAQNTLFSGSSDGCLKLWNYKTSECTMTFTPPTVQNSIEKDIYNILKMGLFQNQEETFLICNKS